MTETFETNGMTFLLNNDDHTAELINASGEVIIPKSVLYDSIEYIITNIHKEAFKSATSLEFAPDS